MSTSRKERSVKVPRPARLIATIFAGAILVGTAALMLPAAKRGPGGTGFVEALFTATSAVTVTGLTVVDTGTHWSPFGQAILLVLFQMGGLGILTLASVSALLVWRKLGLRRRIEAQAEAALLEVGEVKDVVVRIVTFSLVVETIVAAVLIARFLTLGEEPGEAIWSGAFHAVSAYNHAGFALYSDSLTQYVTDPWINSITIAAIVIGGLGFPVIFELLRRTRPRNWSLHTKLTLTTTGILFVIGTIGITALEWANEKTLGGLSPLEKIQAGLFQGVTPRSAGLNTLDYTQMSEPTLLLTDILMFIGGSPGSTAGGIKVTTFALLAYVIWAELRGETDVTLFRRRVPTTVIRQALTVALLAVGLVTAGTMALLLVTPFEFAPALFETISAFATVGLSLGVSAEAGAAGQLVLTVLMYLGRIGPLTLGTALALRQREKLYRYPEERPIIA